MARTTGNAKDLITFTRASTGTFLGSNGLLQTAAINTPRVEYDANGVAKGLLIEEARTNLENYSETFAAGWTLGSGSFTGQKLSPSGENTAKEVTVTAVNTNYFYKNYTASPSTTYTFSFFCKSGTIDVENDLILAFYDESNLVFISSNATRTYTSSVNGFTRVHSTVTTPAGCTALRCYPHRNITVAGTYDIYGAQLEAGSFPTSYIPTSGATATRSADLASVSVSEFGYNQAQGSVVVEAEVPADQGSINALLLLGPSTWAGSNANKIYSAASTSRHLRVFNSSGSEVVSIDAGETPVGQTFKQAFALASSDYAAVIDGGSVVTSAVSHTPSNVELMVIGAVARTHIKSINYYPLRLSDAKLQELTS